MKNTHKLKAIPALLLSAFAVPIYAAPLPLAQTPPGAAFEPLPNIIVSVDDSGSMGTAGMATLKAALTATFSAANLADRRVRLAWQSMNTCRAISSNGNTPAGCTAYNGIRTLEGAHRTNFLNWVATGLPVTPAGNTGSHRMMERSGEYLRTTGQWSPWRSEPGSTTDTTERTCRKTFNIFMTDGAWNADTGSVPFVDGNSVVKGGGNADGTTKALPDGTAYDVAAANTQTRIYRDQWGYAGLSTLSDLAFHYWSTDLQPGIANEVRFPPKVVAPETYGTTALQPYWNPKNNPANWQHMTTYTIGFNAQAVTWAGTPARWVGAESMFTAASLGPLANGTTTWVSPLCAAGVPGGGNLACSYANPGSQFGTRDGVRSSELWHMALNSRGRFVPAPNAASLTTAFKQILDEILSSNTQPLVNVAGSSSGLRTDGFFYVGEFNSDGWSGGVSAYAVNADTKVVSNTRAWRAETELDAAGFSLAGRNVLTFNNGTNAGSDFNTTAGNLSANQLTLLQGADSTAIRDQRINYLRGDRSLETGAVFRARKSRFGDVVNSGLWVVGAPLRLSFEYEGHAAYRLANNGRTPAIYVGANDGMLHAINASDTPAGRGKELFSYVPKGVYSNLREYTTPAYTHKFFVDGNPFTADVDVNGSNTVTDWRTVLISGLGLGGRGYFVLDVTTPDAMNKNKVLVDRTAASSTVEESAGIDADVNDDLGHIFDKPVVDSQSFARSEQVMKMNNGRWAVVMGNGLNSVNERPVLVVQYLDGNREVKTIVAKRAKGTGNGLAAPRLLDVNSDGQADIAYAGDQQGNLWKFNLTSDNDNNWGVSNYTGTVGSAPCKVAAANESCTPLFVASQGGIAQPISVAPLTIRNPAGGVQVFFGTGRNATVADRSSTAQQTLYSIQDKATYEFSTTGAGVNTKFIVRAKDQDEVSDLNDLVEQTVDTVIATGFSRTSKNAVNYNEDDRGWYLNLSGADRERSLVNSFVFQQRNAAIVTTSPNVGTSDESCAAQKGEDKNKLYVLDLLSGFAPPTDPFNTEAGGTGEGRGNVADVGAVVPAFSRDDRNRDAVDVFQPKRSTNADGSESTSPQIPDNPSGTINPALFPGARNDWREIQ